MACFLNFCHHVAEQCDGGLHPPFILLSCLYVAYDLGREMKRGMRRSIHQCIKDMLLYACWLDRAHVKREIESISNL